MMPKLETRVRELSEAGIVRDAAPILERSSALRPIAPRVAAHRGRTAISTRATCSSTTRLSVTAIIDWGDVHFGDPAVDLSIVFSLIPPPSARAFFAAYGSPGEAALSAARFRAVYHSAMVAHYGYRIADADLLHIGTRGLALALR